MWSWVIRRIFSTKDAGVEYPAKACVLSLWGPQGVDEKGVDHGSRVGAFPVLPQTSTTNRLRSAAGKQLRLRGSYEPAHTSRGREQVGDARWVGGVLSASAVLDEPGGGVAGVPASGLQAPLSFLIRRKTRGSEVRALPTPVTSGPGLSQTSSSDRRPRGGATTRFVDL